MLKCDQCDFEAKTAAGLAAHKRGAHGKKTKPKRVAARKTARPRADNGTVFHFCPKCGTDLDKLKKAVDLYENSVTQLAELQQERAP